jgi:hypothetical protein
MVSTSGQHKTSQRTSAFKVTFKASTFMVYLIRQLDDGTVDVQLSARV